MEFSWTLSPFFLAHLYVPVLYIPKFGIELQTSLSRAFLVAGHMRCSRGWLHVFLKVAFWLALLFAKALGPSGDRGRWPWRALRWRSPCWRGCMFSCNCTE